MTDRRWGLPLVGLLVIVTGVAVFAGATPTLAAFSDSNTVEVSVNASAGFDTPPRAEASVSDSWVTIDEAVRFDSSDSTDDVGIESSQWRFGDGSEASGTVVNHSFDGPGTYTVSLEVTDSADQSNRTDFTITVVDRTPPDAALRAETESAVVGEEIEFDGSASTDNHAIQQLSWDFGANRSETGSIVTQSFGESGDHTVTLTATDASGNTETKTVTIHVSETTDTSTSTTDTNDTDGSTTTETTDSDGSTTDTSDEDSTTDTSDSDGSTTTNSTDDGNETDLNTTADEPPTASVSVDQSTVGVGETVEFDASGSTDDTNITAYEWDGGNVSGSGETLSHSWDSPGEYTVTVTVTDGSGQTDSASATVTVEDQTPPSVSISASSTNVSVNSSVEFEASGSSDITSYDWRFGDGGSASGSSVSHTFTSAGEFTVEVTVSDSAGNEATADVTVEVHS